MPISLSILAIAPSMRSSRSRRSAARSILLILDRRLALLADRLQAAQRVAQRGRRGRASHPHARGRLVDQVDRLIGQEPIGHIARREMRGSLDRVVGDLELMEILVAALDAAQNLDRLLLSRLVDHHRLEAPLQRRVALDILAILVKRRRADRLKLAARERRLEDVGRVKRALGAARADDRMELIDEQDAARLLDLVHHPLEALLELAAIFGAGHQRAHIERHDPLALDLSGTSPATIRCARPSTIAVLPTPGSPISAGLFLVRRERIWITRSISC